MPANSSTQGHDVIKHELEALRKEWWWFFLLGLLLILSGTVAIGYAFLASVAVVTLFGFLMVVGGVAQIVTSFWVGRWSGFAISLLAGVMYVVVGGMVVARPAIALEAFTLLIGSFLLVGGAFRAITAMATRLQDWGWLLLNGLIAGLLGLLVLAEWPESSIWVVGVFVGVDMLFNGWAWVMLSMGLRALPE